MGHIKRYKLLNYKYFSSCRTYVLSIINTFEVLSTETPVSIKLLLWPSKLFELSAYKFIPISGHP